MVYCTWYTYYYLLLCTVRRTTHVVPYSSTLATGIQEQGGIPAGVIVGRLSFVVSLFFLFLSLLAAFTFSLFLSFSLVPCFFMLFQMELSRALCCVLLLLLLLCTAVLLLLELERYAVYETAGKKTPSIPPLSIVYVLSVLCCLLYVLWFNRFKGGYSAILPLSRWEPNLNTSTSSSSSSSRRASAVSLGQSEANLCTGTFALRILIK